MLRAVDDFLSGGQKVAKAPSTSAAVIADAVPIAGWGHPAYTGTMQARSISLSSEMRVADLKT